jgi:hypothetical protein
VLRTGFGLSQLCPLELSRTLLRFPLGFHLFQGSIEASGVALLFGPDLLRRVLADESALRCSTKMGYRRETFVQVLTDSDRHSQAAALIYR